MKFEPEKSIEPSPYCFEQWEYIVVVLSVNTSLDNLYYWYEDKTLGYALQKSTELLKEEMSLIHGDRKLDIELVNISYSHHIIHSVSTIKE